MEGRLRLLQIVADRLQIVSSLALCHRKTMENSRLEAEARKQLSLKMEAMFLVSWLNGLLRLLQASLFWDMLRAASHLHVNGDRHHIPALQDEKKKRDEAVQTQFLQSTDLQDPSNIPIQFSTIQYNSIQTMHEQCKGDVGGPMDQRTNGPTDLARGNSPGGDATRGAGFKD